MTGAIRIRPEVDAKDSPIGTPATLQVLASAVRGEDDVVIYPAPLRWDVPADGAVCDGIPETDGTFYYTALLERSGSLPKSKRIEVGPGTVNWNDLVEVDPTTFEPLDPIPPSVQELLAQTITSGHVTSDGTLVLVQHDGDELNVGQIGGATDDQVREAVEVALPGFLSSGGSVHLGAGAPPDLIVGAKVGDVYIDTTTGTIYKLEEG